MKKAFGVLLALFLLLAGAAGRADAPAPLGTQDFLFVFESKVYSLGMPAGPLINAVEAKYGPFSVFEAESCLFSGMDRELENADLLLGTYPIGPGGTDALETIMVTGGAFQTPRKIGIGSTKAEVIAAYGESFILDYDTMLYSTGSYLSDPVLAFTLDLSTNTVLSYYIMQNTGM